MKMKMILMIIFLMLMSINSIRSQWMIYNNKNSPLNIMNIGNINQFSDNTYWIYQQGQGLFKFDGINQWYEFNNITDTYGIFDELTPSSIDSLGNIYWGISGGLLKYDGEKHNGYDFELITGYNSILPKGLGRVNGIVVDKDNILWLATSDKGILAFDVKNNTVKEYNIDNTPITDNTIEDILIDNKGVLWGICGSNVEPPEKDFIPCLFRYDGINWEVFTPFNSGLSVESPQSLAIDSSGNVWVGGIANLQKYDGEKWISYEEILMSLCNYNSWTAVIDLDVDKKFMGFDCRWLLWNFEIRW